MKKKGKKISILGVGNVGASIAFRLTIEGLANEIVLIDINKEKAEAEAMDLMQGTPFTSNINIYSGDYKDTVDSDIVIITAGLNRKPGQSRLDLAQANADIMKGMIPEVVSYAPHAIYVVVSNPVDIMTYVITKISGLPSNQVIGSGTMLDTARLRAAIASEVKVAAQNVHAFVLGEHGDSAVIPWSLTAISGMPMSTFAMVNSPDKASIGNSNLTAIEENVRTSGAKIIHKKGATYYAIALAVNKLCETILKDSNIIYSVSTLLDGQYGINDVCVSLPFIVGASGIKREIVLKMTDQEQAMLVKSAESIKNVIKSLNI